MGESVVLDASWGRAARRDEARALAAARGARIDEIRCDLPPALAAERVRARRAAGEGPSDATPAIADALAARQEEWPQARVLDTAGPPAAVIAEARRLVAAGTDEDMRPPG